MSCEVTVLLPCLNEAETVAVCVLAARASLAALGVDGEVLVADNGSIDGSQELAAGAGARVVLAPVAGYGGALLAGIAEARGRYVIMADADDSYDLGNLGPFVDHAARGPRPRDGQPLPRRHRPGRDAVAAPPHRQPGAVLARPAPVPPSRRGRLPLRHPRLPPRPDRALGLCMPGMEFASEMVVRAALAGYRIAEVPTTLRPDGRSRPPHLRRWRDGWRHLRFLLVFAPGKTLVRPGAAVAALGLAGVALLAPAPRRGGRRHVRRQRARLRLRSGARGRADGAARRAWRSCTGAPRA